MSPSKAGDRTRPEKRPSAFRCRAAQVDPEQSFVPGVEAAYAPSGEFCSALEFANHLLCYRRRQTFPRFIGRAARFEQFRLSGFSGWPRTGVNEGGAEEAGVEPTEDACAPSNGFEARAPHRERYSSTLILLRFRRCSQRRFGKTGNFCQKCLSSVQPRAGNGINQRECPTGKSWIGSRNSGQAALWSAYRVLHNLR